jgi:hypothetical protein
LVVAGVVMVPLAFLTIVTTATKMEPGNDAG